MSNWQLLITHCCCMCAYETVKEMMQAAGLPLRDSNAMGSGDNAAVPGMIEGH